MTYLASNTAIATGDRAAPLTLDPFTVQLAGSGAAILVVLAALFAALPGAPVIEAVAGGGLVLFAGINAHRAYRRFWAPALVLLGLVGAAGVMLSMLPAADAEVGMTSLARFGLQGLRNAAQLGAVAMTAYAWSTAGRSHRRMQASMLVVAALAVLQLAQAGHGALVGSSVPGWQVAIDGVFAFWLWATAMGMAHRQRGAGRLVGRPSPR